MNIFAIDSSGKSASVAVMQNGIFLYTTSVQTGFTHSETLLPLCITAFEKTGLSPNEIDVFAVSVGPGSFTGLRIGLSTIKAFALSNRTPVAAVSTLEALVYATSVAPPDYTPPAIPLQRVFLSALDARRDEVYYAIFEEDHSIFKRLAPDDAAPIESLRPFVQQSQKPLFFIGDGAQLCYNVFQEIGGTSLYPTDNLCIAAGAALCAKEMAIQGKLSSASDISPIYHRLSQAERERKSKMQKGETNL